MGIYGKKPPPVNVRAAITAKVLPPTHRSLTQRPEVVFIDVQTSGLDPTKDDLIGFGAVVLDRETWRELEAIEFKIAFDPGNADAESLRRSGYTSAKWTNAILPDAARERICGFFDRHCSVTKISQRNAEPYYVAQVAAHNAQHHAEFLLKWIRRGEDDNFLPADTFNALDTLALARWAQLDLADYKLPTVCGFFKIPQPAEGDAIGHARASAAVAAAMLRRMHG